MSRTVHVSCKLTVDQLMEWEDRQPQFTVASAMRRYLTLSPGERAAAAARIDAERASEIAAREAEQRRPRSLVGCEPGAIISLRVVQHDRRENSMLISVDGRPSKAKWVPIAGKPAKPGKPGKPITTVYFTARAWEPGSLGFHIVLIPGWLASDRAFTRCECPQLSADVTWTSSDLAAWEILNEKVAKDKRNAAAAARNEKDRVYRQAMSDAARQERRTRGAS